MLNSVSSNLAGSSVSISSYLSLELDSNRLSLRCESCRHTNVSFSEVIHSG